jgi:hypothetical protein
MARIRSIKPEFFTSLTIGSLSERARLAFIGIWTFVDDYGRAVDDARLVKAAVFPLDDRITVKAVAEVLDGWAATRLVGGTISSSPTGTSTRRSTAALRRSCLHRRASLRRIVTETTARTRRGCSEDASRARYTIREQGAGSRERIREQQHTRARDRPSSWIIRLLLLLLRRS